MLPLFSPKYFISAQLTTSYLTAPAQAVLTDLVARDDTATLLAWQLGNAYLLLGFLGVFILNTTTELSVVRAYLWALWLGDVGHIGFSLWAMGLSGIMDIGSWTAVMHGNVNITLFLFITRSLYFLGVFDGRVEQVIEEQRIEEYPGKRTTTKKAVSWRESQRKKKAMEMERRVD